MTPLSPPLNSLDPDEWDVYADWLTDYPDPRLPADKVRRIAFVLRHWKRSGPAGPDVDARWLELKWYRGSRRRRNGTSDYDRTCGWSWQLAYFDPRRHKVTAPSTYPISYGQDRLTNPSEEPRCRVDKRLAWKFYTSLLERRFTRSLLGPKWDEYRRTFLGYKVANTLSHWIGKDVKVLRRVHWVRGEHLVVLSVEKPNGRVVATCEMRDPSKPPEWWSTLAITSEIKPYGTSMGDKRVTVRSVDWLPV